MFYTQTSLIVRYAETDQMGVVHHSNYPVWFEAGRTEFIEKAGMPYSVVEQRGILLPLIELQCKYKGFAQYEDKITVKTQLKDFTYTRVVFSYEVYKNGLPDPITLGETVHVWTNKQLKPLNIKKHLPEIYDLMSKVSS